MAAHEMQDQVVTWLNDALGIEEALVHNLTQQLDHVKEFPQVRQMLEEHIEETKQQADMVRDRIKQLGGSPSTMKTAVGKVQGWFQGTATGPAEDRVIKDLVADHAAKHLEIATYTAIREAAKAIGDHTTASLCDQILKQEQKTGQRIEQAIPTVVKEYMAKKGRQKAA